MMPPMTTLDTITNIRMVLTVWVMRDGDEYSSEKEGEE